MQLHLIRELLEDKDILGYIKAGCTATIYDAQAASITEQLSADLSLAQIAKIIWNAFYAHLGISVVHTTKREFVLDKKQAVYVLGEPERFLDIAKLIRQMIKY